MSKWLGDSVGRWEGDTLVVESKNFHSAQEVRIGTSHSVYIPTTATITERFTRVDADEILYQFTVADDKAYSASWVGEMPMHRSPNPLYEYACHEGNYAMPGILAGARKLESEGKRVGRP
jgi:hypothetical protein